MTESESPIYEPGEPEQGEKQAADSTFVSTDIVVPPVEELPALRIAEPLSVAPAWHTAVLVAGILALSFQGASKEPLKNASL